MTRQSAARSRRATTAKTFVEFFAGIGLVREALGRHGWTCAYANDIDPKKEELYRLRFGAGDHFHRGDVWETEEVVTRIEGRPFLATASFPCVDLSLAGHGRGLSGSHSSTFFGFTKILSALGERRPPAVMLENVVGFLTSHDGADFRQAAEAMAGLGYHLDALVLDARHFVPQSRPRVFVLGVHESVRSPAVRRQSDHPELFDETWEERIGRRSPQLCPPKLRRLLHSIKLKTGWAAFDFPPPPVREAPLAELIDVDDEQEWWDESNVAKHVRMMSEDHRTLAERLQREGGTHVGTIFRRRRHDKTRAEVRFDGLAGCLRTPRGGSARQIVIAIDRGALRMRWMSPREYARLQGVGDFPLTANVNQNLFGFGDAVCVPAVEWVERHALGPLFESMKPKGAVLRPR